MQEGVISLRIMDDIRKFDYVGLPPLEAFYSTLKKDASSYKYYQHAMDVFMALLCELFRGYLLVHLKIDVLLLANMFDNFRTACLTLDELDPSHYLSSSGLAWGAMLLTTGAVGPHNRLRCWA